MPPLPAQTLQAVASSGVAVNFGYTVDNVSFPNARGIQDQGGFLTGFLLQSTDIEQGADVEDVRVLQGDKVAQNFYDIHESANLRLFVAGTGKANAISLTTLGPWSPGALIVIQSCPSQPDLVATNWVVQPGAKMAGDITKSAEITIPLQKRPGITSTQPS